MNDCVKPPVPAGARSRAAAAGLALVLVLLAGCEGFSTSGGSVNTEEVSGTYQANALITVRRLDNGGVATQPGQYTFIVSRRGRMDGSSDGGGVVYGPVNKDGEFIITGTINRFSGHPDCQTGDVTIQGLADGNALRAIVSSTGVRCGQVELEIGGTITGQRTASASTAITLDSIPGGSGAAGVLNEAVIRSVLVRQGG